MIELKRREKVGVNTDTRVRLQEERSKKIGIVFKNTQKALQTAEQRAITRDKQTKIIYKLPEENKKKSKKLITSLFRDSGWMKLGFSSIYFKS